MHYAPNLVPKEPNEALGAKIIFTIEITQRDKEVLLKEDALNVMRKCTRLKPVSIGQGFPM
jgi:hypothetical protein